MSGLARLWARVVARLATREPATPLALFRIAVGLIVLHTLVDTVATDALGLVWLSDDHGGYRPLKPDSWLISALGGLQPQTVWALVGVGMASAAALILGAGGRVAALVLLQCCIALFAINPGTGGGHDKLITNGLWLLVLSPSTATLALDCRIRTGAWVSHRWVSAWPRYLMIFQIAMVYGITGIQKLGSSWFPWGGYKAVYISLLLPSWARWDLAPFVGWLDPLLRIGTAVTWVWEVTWPVVLLAFVFRASRTADGRLRAFANRVDLRKIYVVIGILVHGGIWATMNLGPFSAITVAFYLPLFHHDEYQRMWQRLRGLRASQPA